MSGAYRSKSGRPSFFDLGGTAPRPRMWLMLVLLFATVVGSLALSRAHVPHGEWAFPVLGVVSGLSGIASVQRLHDTGRSGYWLVIGAIPFVGLLLAAYLLFAPSRSFLSTARTQHPVAQNFYAVVLCAVLVLCCARVAYQPFVIPSESMKDTLLIGDYVVVSHLAKDYKRGDVVVFRHPVNGEDYIKRLIGLPGDMIQMKDGLLVINGTVAPQVDAGLFRETYAAQGAMAVTPRCSNAPVGQGGTCEKQRAVETLPSETGVAGVSHDVLNIDANGYGDNTDGVTVPQGQYFFIGDNRDTSLDSRFSQAAGGVGFVPAQNLEGRAVRILFSAAGTSLFQVWTWRADRFFKAVE